MDIDLESLIAEAKHVAQLCAMTAEKMSTRADTLERRRRLWRVLEVAFAVVGIMSQQPVMEQLFEGHTSIPVFISSACFLALISSSIYHANVVSDTPERIRDHLRYIDEYAAKLSFEVGHHSEDPPEMRKGRLEELLKLAKFNLNDTRQKWRWAMPANQEPISSVTANSRGS